MIPLHETLYITWPNAEPYTFRHKTDKSATFLALQLTSILKHNVLYEIVKSKNKVVSAPEHHGDGVGVKLDAL